MIEKCGGMESVFFFCLLVVAVYNGKSYTIPSIFFRLDWVELAFLLIEKLNKKNNKGKLLKR